MPFCLKVLAAVPPHSALLQYSALPSPPPGASRQNAQGDSTARRAGSSGSRPAAQSMPSLHSSAGGRAERYGPAAMPLGGCSRSGALPARQAHPAVQTLPPHTCHYVRGRAFLPAASAPRILHPAHETHSARYTHDETSARPPVHGEPSGCRTDPRAYLRTAPPCPGAHKQAGCAFVGTWRGPSTLTHELTSRDNVRVIQNSNLPHDKQMAWPPSGRVSPIVDSSYMRQSLPGGYLARQSMDNVSAPIHVCPGS